MNEKNILYAGIGLLLGVFLTGFFARSAVNNQNFSMMGMMGMRNSSSMMSSTTDQHFIEQMIPHHDDAITMAKLALQKAQHQEIKDLSRNIIESQTAENNKMREWYKQWIGREVPDTFGALGHGMGSGMMHGGMMGNSSDISSLESAAIFDKEFIEQMIPHHQMAVMMAQMLKSSSSRPEMRQLAEDIINAQTAEIEQMRTWYQSWYK